MRIGKCEVSCKLRVLLSYSCLCCLGLRTTDLKVGKLTPS